MSYDCAHIISLSEEPSRGQLYLSGVGMLARPEVLRDILRVGAVLSVMDPWAFGHYKVGAKMEHLQLAHKWVKVQDDEEFSLLPFLPQTNAFLAAELAKHNVLVHCQAGVSRSPSVVIAFLMHTQGLTYAAAKTMVKKKRSCIEPNKGFEKDLLSLQKDKKES